MNPFVKIEQGIETGAKVVGHFFEDIATVDKAFHALSPEVKTAAATLVKDVLQVVSDLGTATAAKGIDFAADSKSWADILQLVSDAKAGEAVAVNAVKAFGVKL